MNQGRMVDIVNCDIPNDFSFYKKGFSHGCDSRSNDLIVDFLSWCFCPKYSRC